MDHDHSHGGGGGMSMSPPPLMTPPSGTGSMNMSHHHMMMSMTFYWGRSALILFQNWPGSDNPLKYYLSLLFVFVLAFFVEAISRSKFIKKPGITSDVVSGMMLTLMHTIRMGLAYVVMLAVMSFNGGVFIVAVLGHAFGFLLFGTKIWFKKKDKDGNHENGCGGGREGGYLPPMAC